MSAQHPTPPTSRLRLLDEAYAVKIDAALRGDDPRSVQELVAAHAQEARLPDDPRPARAPGRAA